MDTYHFFHLSFGGGAVAGEGFLDFVWSVFENWNVVLSGDEQDDTASFSDGDAGGDILGKEEAFDGDKIGF